MKSRPSRRGRKDQGYILLTLMLFVTLLVIAAAAIAPSVMFEVKRDREEELIHRGVQYSRAVRKYVKKFGRYPMRIEELENTNNQRFLRKRYKDPITGKDFKLLHLGDVQSVLAQGIVANAIASNPSGVGINPATGVNPAVAAFAARTFGGPAAGANAAPTPQNPNDASQNQGGDNQSDGQGEDTNNVPPTGVVNMNNLSGQVFGGGPIVGVASVSKDKSIREFNKKNHYDQWQFIYDPNTDRGGLLNTPAQPPLNPFGQNGMPGGVVPSGFNGGGNQSSTPFAAPQSSAPTPQPPEQ